MGKAKRAKVQLKGTPISKFESRPWKCPRCFKRVKTKAALIGHWKGNHKNCENVQKFELKIYKVISGALNY